MEQRCRAAKRRRDERENSAREEMMEGSGERQARQRARNLFTADIE